MRLAWNWFAPVALLATLACSHELDGPAPAIVTFEPPLVCNIVRTEVTITGSGLSPLAIDALTDNPKLKLPQITLQRVQDQNGTPVSDAPVVIPDDPANPAASDVHWVSQTELHFFVDPSLMLPPGTYTVTVTNGNGKSFTATVDLTVVEPPVLISIVPQSSCPQGGAVDISGTGFAPTATASIGGQMLTTDNVTPTELMATLGPGLSPGTYDVVVDNGGGCTDTLPDAFVITPGVAVFFVDPNVDYNAINTQVNIFVSGLIQQPISVTIQPTGGGASQTLDPFVWSASKPNRIQAIIPIGLTPGQWDLTVDDGNCAATLSPAFTVTDTLTVAIASIDPLFGRPDEDTAVTIRATDPAPGGFVQFSKTPRAFLNPDSGGATAIANQLVAVNFVSATQLTAIVPKGLPPGLYDLIVINPEGTVGLLDKAFIITPPEAPPPVVNEITPGSVINKPAQLVEISGANFRNPTVTATCQMDTGGMLTVNATGVTTDGTTVDATFDMSPLSPAVCVLRITDDDGTFADFSALAVSLPSANVPQSVADQPMTAARRALAAAAGRVTPLARFLYAIGGDDGTDAGLLASIEAAPIDPFGRLSASFTVLPAGLPEGRSFTKAVTIGRFIYLPGGRTAIGATNSVLRAQVLDPRAVPEISDVAFEPIPAGLTPGLYYYRVSAVMTATDPSNPGGETLPSDPISIVVPTIEGGSQVKLTLFWGAVPGAEYYKVYRSPTSNGSLEDIVLVGDDLAMPQFPDAGEAPVSPAEVPLAPGSLGVWHEVGPLSTTREGAGVAFAQDPDTPGGYFLYVIGGREADTGMALRDYDYAAISQAADGSQTVGAFSSGGTLLTTGRWQLAAVAADHAHAPRVAAGQTYIYALDGVDMLGGAVGDVTAGLVNGDGTLTGQEVNDVSANSSGYAYAVAANFLYHFGGGAPGALPTTTAQSAEICVPGSNCDPPELINWNNFGFALVQPRWLPGSALESAFIFMVGGASTGANTASNTVERTHW